MPEAGPNRAEPLRCYQPFHSQDLKHVWCAGVEGTVLRFGEHHVCVRLVLRRRHEHGAVGAKETRILWRHERLTIMARVGGSGRQQAREEPGSLPAVHFAPDPVARGLGDTLATRSERASTPYETARRAVAAVVNMPDILPEPIGTGRPAWDPPGDGEDGKQVERVRAERPTIRDVDARSTPTSPTSRRETAAGAANMLAPDPTSSVTRRAVPSAVPSSRRPSYEGSAPSIRATPSTEKGTTTPSRMLIAAAARATVRACRVALPTVTPRIPLP